jgi:glycosyltransferase involved in cell wall biosynthesis
MRVPAGLAWEVLVVDNGSRDATADVVAGFTDRLPVRRVVEPVAGLSLARNRGVAAATGDYVLWTDDDCTPQAEWLAAYAAAFERDPQAALFGGCIDPVLATPSPAWFAQNLDMLEWLVAARDFGPAPLPLSIADNRLPFGANAAVRMQEQKRFLYNPALGVSARRRMVGEELDVFRAILNAGGTGWWVPDARIGHQIAAERQTAGYVRAYYRGQGRFGAYRDLAGGGTAAGVLAYYGPRLVLNWLLYKGLRRVLPARFALRRLMNLGSCEGALSMVLRGK